MSASVRAAGRNAISSGLTVPLLFMQRAYLRVWTERTLSFYGVRELSHGLPAFAYDLEQRVMAAFRADASAVMADVSKRRLYVHGEISAMESRYEARAEASGRRNRAAYRRLFGMPS